MISELRHLVQRNEGVEAADIQSATYHLLSRQFLLRHKPRHRRYYELVVRFPSYFATLMETLNHQFVMDEERGFVGVMPRELVRRMNLEETLFLLLLRYLYDEAVCNYSANDDSTVDITLEDIEVRYRDFAKRDLPRAKGDFLRLIDPFMRLGIIEIGSDENQPDIERLRILPTVAALIGGDALKRVEIYLKDDGVDTSDDEESGE